MPTLNASLADKSADARADGYFVRSDRRVVPVGEYAMLTIADVAGALGIPATHPGNEYVYVVSAHDTPLVKIGRTRNPRARFATMRTDSPVALSVLLLIVAGRETERLLHQHFAAYRARGEWYRFEGDFADAVCAAHRLADPRELIDWEELTEDPCEGNN